MTNVQHHWEFSTRVNQPTMVNKGKPTDSHFKIPQVLENWRGCQGEIKILRTLITVVGRCKNAKNTYVPPWKCLPGLPNLLLPGNQLASKKERWDEWFFNSSREFVQIIYPVICGAVLSKTVYFNLKYTYDNQKRIIMIWSLWLSWFSWLYYH